MERLNRNLINCDHVRAGGRAERRLSSLAGATPVQQQYHSITMCSSVRQTYQPNQNPTTAGNAGPILFRGNEIELYMLGLPIVWLGCT